MPQTHLLSQVLNVKYQLQTLVCHPQTQRWCPERRVVATQCNVIYFFVLIVILFGLADGVPID